MIEVSQQFGLDILHAHYAVPHATAAYLAKQAMGKGAPKTVCTLHGTDITLVGSDRSFYEITRFSIDAVDGVTSVSDFLRNKTIEVFGTQRHIEAIRNFVDTSRFYPRTEDECHCWFAPKGEKLVAHLSNFRPVKNVTGVVEMFSRLRQKMPAAADDRRRPDTAGVYPGKTRGVEGDIERRNQRCRSDPSAAVPFCCHQLRSI
jgi:N-acetyl-alpha-D-glucosaminyl L-malate synthase BshA